MKTYDELKKLGAYDEKREQEIVARIPERFKKADIDTAPDFLQQYVFGEKNGRGLYIYGPVGTGKTYAAWALYKILMANRVMTRVTNSAELLQSIRDDFKYSNQSYYESKFRSMLDFEGVLIIDDFGAEKVTDWTLETLYVLINKRYERQSYTYFTSNYSIEELAERIGDRIVSRVVEMCHVKHLGGKDRRLP